ncbi:hypothetical protein BpHYR1_018502 [Brachionus plicatilis]|uniref:Uncharacterized protein n=1 Tax=Brachionus plicatilis TaxID=10195 RepID=A0A3M7R0G7_BRAPC|nr:hypothetical protein BpHYR1_018502 [Brachionus plicatilis]
MRLKIEKYNYGSTRSTDYFYSSIGIQSKNITIKAYKIKLRTVDLSYLKLIINNSCREILV